LLVEDEPKMAHLPQRGLGKEGVVADLAGGGEDALWMARASEYDAIARAHHGHAHARIRPEGGADVWISLQQQDQPDQREGAPPAANSASAG
jgi:hypothetical protein